MLSFSRFWKNKKAGGALIGLLLVSLVLMSLSNESMATKPQEIGRSVFTFFQGGFSAIGNFFSGTVNSIQTLRKLQEEHDLLKDQLTHYASIESNMEELQTENRLLREQLGYKNVISFDHIPAQVIARDISQIYNGITLNKGTRDGVLEGMPVIVFFEGYQALVGKIESATSGASVLLPLYDPNCYVAARLQRSRYNGLLNGQFGYSDNLNLSMQYIKKRAREEIRINDEVVTSGDGSIYPKGLLIGRVMSIEAKNWESSLTLEIEPAVDFNRLESVYILKADTE